MSFGIQPGDPVQPQANKAFWSDDVLTNDDTQLREDDVLDSGTQALYTGPANNQPKPLSNEPSQPGVTDTIADIGARNEFQFVAARNEGQVRSSTSADNTDTTLIAGKPKVNVPRTGPANEITSPLPVERPGAASRRQGEGDSVPTRQTNAAALSTVVRNSADIKRAGATYHVSPETIAAIQFEEGRRYSSQDAADDKQARDYINNRSSPGWGSQDWKKSLGTAQMQVVRVEELIQSGKLNIPPDVAGARAVPTAAEYKAMNNDDRYKTCVNLLLSQRAAPYLIGADLRDRSLTYVSRGGDNAISLPASGSASKVRDSEQYRLLTQIYSQDINKVIVRPDSKPGDNMNYRGLDAYHNIGVIRDALYNGRVTQFDGWRYGFNN